MAKDPHELAALLPAGSPRCLLVDFSVPVAQRLSDLAGIEADLSATKAICDRMQTIKVEDLYAKLAASAPTLAAATTTHPETKAAITDFMDKLMLADALFDAAVIKFGRTQATGARTGISREWIAELPQDLQNAYEHVINLRNRFIAHPVAPLEDNQVFVAVQMDGTRPIGVESVTVGKGRI